jgi:hypothetical protein
LLGVLNLLVVSRASSSVSGGNLHRPLDVQTSVSSRKFNSPARPQKCQYPCGIKWSCGGNDLLVWPARYEPGSLPLALDLLGGVSSIATTCSGSIPFTAAEQTLANMAGVLRRSGKSATRFFSPSGRWPPGGPGRPEAPVLADPESIQ